MRHLKTMLNMVDVATGQSFLLLLDEQLRSAVARATGLHFDGEIARADRVVLRKQIVDTLAGFHWDFD